jgi:hypothetical protein
LGQSDDSWVPAGDSFVDMLGAAGVNDPQLGSHLEISERVLAWLAAYRCAVGGFLGS